MQANSLRLFIRYMENCRESTGKKEDKNGLFSIKQKRMEQNHRLLLRIIVLVIR